MWQRSGEKGGRAGTKAEARYAWDGRMGQITPRFGEELTRNSLCLEDPGIAFHPLPVSHLDVWIPLLCLHISSPQ